MYLYTKIPFALLFVFIIFTSPTMAQEAKEGSETVALTLPIAVEDKGPEDELDRGTPRGSIIGFLSACSDFEFDRAAEYLDLRNLPEEITAIGGHELARQLNHVLSRSVWLDDYNVSDKPGGKKGDGLPDYRDELLRIPTPDGGIPIWMQHVPRGDGVKIWKISNRSVAQIPELYDFYSYPEPIEKVRRFFPEDVSFLGLEAFKWAILLTVALVCWPIFYLVGWLLARIFSSPSKDSYPYVKKLFRGPLVFIAILLVVGIFLNRLGAGAYAQQVMDANTLMTIAFVWFLIAVINLYKNTKQNKLVKADRPGAAKLLNPMTFLLKMVVILFGLLFWLNNVGVNITTVLAGLGVGGLAVALALQKPIEDMMGALTIFSQASVRVGDLCRYGSTIGHVEEIGLRTTRIRSLTNSVVSIPNSQIAYLELENLSYRKKIRYWPTLRLRYDVKPEQIRRICKRIVDMLLASDKVYDDPIRARFTDFEEDSISIKVHCFMKTTDFPESLEYREELNLAIMDIVKEEGAVFALPGRSIYMEGDESA
jgi:MscS family membrane protein